MNKFLMMSLCAVLWCLGGCGGAGQRHPPPPTISIEILDADDFLMDGQSMDREQLEDALKRRGKIGSNPITHTTRARVRIVADGGPANATARKIQQYCSSVGLVNVFFERQ